MTISTHAAGASPKRSFAICDAHGQAALLLAESTLHLLVERSLVSVEDAVSAVQTAAEVNLELATESGASRDQLEVAQELLFRISDSFTTDFSSSNGRAS